MIVWYTVFFSLHNFSAEKAQNSNEEWEVSTQLQWEGML